MAYKKYKHKSVTFDPKSEEDMGLHKKLKKLGHGEFNRITKDMWRRRLLNDQK